MLGYSTNVLSPIQQYTVTLDLNTTNPVYSFLGLLFRLNDKNGEDVSDVFSVGNDSNVQQKSSGCASDVSAITHANKDNKRVWHSILSPTPPTAPGATPALSEAPLIEQRNKPYPQDSPFFLI